MDFRFDVVLEYMPMFLDGLYKAIFMTIICLTVGVILGILLGMARMADSRYAPRKYFLRYLVQYPTRVYVSFFRGTPLFVKILLFHFAVMPVFIHPIDGLLISGETARELRANYGAFISGAVAISLNLGAYLSEVFRAGIQSLDKGQTEAANSLGMTYWQTMRHIVLPQAFTKMLPAIGNHAIFTVKDTSLVSAIGYAELAYAARNMSGATARYWEAYLTISFMYWGVVVLMAYGVNKLEQRMGRYDARSH